jgi:hypothetical protein
MSQNLTGKKRGLIHAARITTRAVQKYLDELIPEVEVVHWVDDTIQNTNFASPPGFVPPTNYAKFTQAALSQQAYGVDLILLACSTFNRAVEFSRPMIATPMLQIDRPMMDLAVRHGTRMGLLATVPNELIRFAPALQAWLEQKLPLAWAEFADRAFIKGDGDMNPFRLCERKRDRR